MLGKIAFGVTGLLMLGSITAQASEATQIADRAGFLVGHAHRCGIADGRLERSQGRIDALIAAFSVDEDDKDAAQAQFTRRVLASALAELIDDPLPSCGLVRAQLARFEQHRGPAIAHPGSLEENRMVEENRTTAPPDRTAASPKRAKSSRPATTRREEPTPERRAALELRRAAQQLRGRPPSL